MKYSLSLGKPFGIQVAVHWTFLILIGWLVGSGIMQGDSKESILLTILFVVSLFACVVLHELGHSLAARRFGIQTKNITLLPIGGVANMERIPEKPIQELVVAIAGPLVNVVIAILLGVILWSLGELNLSGGEAAMDLSGWGFANALIAMNLVLVVFNLVPAFPMDGGRVLRSLLAFKMTRERATQIAMTIGQLFAILFVFIGLMNSQPFLILIAVFVYLGAQAEYQMVKSETMLSGYKVGDILMTEFTPLHPFDTLQTAIDIILKGQQQQFVVMDGNKVMGVLTKNDLLKGISQEGVDGRVRQAMSPGGQAVHPSLPLETAYKLIQKSGVTLLPVAEEDEFKGIIDLENIQEFIGIREVIRAAEKSKRG